MVLASAVCICYVHVYTGRHAILQHMHRHHRYCCNIFGMCSRDTQACAMQILTFKESLRVWRSISFLGHFLMVSLMLVSLILPPKPPSKTTGVKKNEQQQQQPKAPSSLKANWAESTATGHRAD